MGLCNQPFISHSIQETKELGKKLIQQLFIHKKNIVAFFGDLGAGKTLFIKGMAEFLHVHENEVTSPTFTYLNIYSSQPPLYHFDLYRMENEKVFLEMGFQEFLDMNQLCVIEWAEKIPHLLPDHAIKVKISSINESTRQIIIQGKDPLWV